MQAQKAICITTDLWEVQTIVMHNTLVSAKTAKQAKEKTSSYLQGNPEILTWPQHIRIKDNVNVIAKQ